jgi:short-subunit dehydrogenase involved in D-alanine esterification of teichoic acids
MLSESIRLQFADTTVKVVELVPPAVRTTAPACRQRAANKAWIQRDLAPNAHGRLHV